jgi:hypothetical protein
MFVRHTFANNPCWTSGGNNLGATELQGAPGGSLSQHVETELQE